MGVLIAVPALFAGAPAVKAIDATAEIPGLWTGSGPGVLTTPNNGVGGLAEFTYNLDQGHSGGVPLQTWDFHTTAAQTGTVKLA